MKPKVEEKKVRFISDRILLVLGILFFGWMLLIPIVILFLWSQLAFSISLCVAAVAFGFHVDKTRSLSSRRICLVLCVVTATLGLMGFPKSYHLLNRGPVTAQEVKTLLQTHRGKLKAAADAIGPGVYFHASRENDEALPYDVRSALRIPGIDIIRRSEDGKSVTFEIGYSNLWGQNEDCRCLVYVPTDEMKSLIPERFADVQPLAADAHFAYYVLPTGDAHSIDWYVQRLEAGWFYVTEIGITMEPNTARYTGE